MADLLFVVDEALGRALYLAIAGVEVQAPGRQTVDRRVEVQRGVAQLDSAGLQGGENGAPVAASLMVAMDAHALDLRVLGRCLLQRVHRDDLSFMDPDEK